MSAGSPTPSGRPDTLWRRRWLMLLSGALVLAALVVLQVTLGAPFHWVLLVWGVLAGVLGALEGVAVTTAAIASASSPDRITWIRRRRVVYAVGWLFLGTEVGMLAATFDLGWLPVALAAYVVVIALVAVAVLVVTKRRGRST